MKYTILLPILTSWFAVRGSAKRAREMEEARHAHVRRILETINTHDGPRDGLSGQHAP